jgi:FKBP-type peptidyl-prolyl cis-trans isomerase (trigger factor)
MDAEELREQIRPNAEKRITHGLVIGKISEAEDFDIKPEDITEEYQRILNDYFGEDEKARDEYLQSGDSVALLNRVSSQYITRKTLDFLKAVALGEDTSPFLKSEQEEEEPIVTENESEENVEGPELEEEVVEANDPAAD